MTHVMIQDYPHRRGGHCGSGALRDLVEWAELGWSGPPSEALIFGLGGGLDFHYFQLPGLVPPIYLGGRNADMELDLCQRLGIDTQRHQTDDPGQGWRWVTDELDAGRPVMVWADIIALPYLRVRLSNTRHDIVVIGYDTDAGMAYVVDNDRDGIQQVPLDALAKARNSSGFPDPNRHATFPLRFPHRLPDLLSAARDAAASAVANLRRNTTTVTGNLVQLPPSGGSCTSGLAGVERFAADVTRWPDEVTAQQLSKALQTLWILVEKAGTGGGLFRRLQADFCYQVSKLTGDTAFHTAGQAYTACAQAWSELAALAATDTPDYAAITACANSLPATEHDAVDALTTAAAQAREEIP